IERSLWTETDENKSKARELRGYLEKARDEICDEPQPDESRLRRYLGKAGEIFSTASFAKQTVDAFTDLLEKLGLS
ncbi:MAG: hypothetical protein ABIH23_04640, partial [bacterium]